MALYNEILVGRYNRLLQKLLSMKGGAPAPQLSGDISASITLESDRTEYLYLGATNRNIKSGSRAADVANISLVGLNAAAMKGVLATVNGILIRGQAAAQSYSIRIQSTASMASLTPGFPIDNRFLGKRTAVQIVDSVEGVASGLEICQVRCPADTSIWVPLQLIFASSHISGPVSTIGFSNFTVGPTAINLPVNVTFFWDERTQEDSEV